MNDCTVAKLDGSEGDWMMYEPFYWSKGINDYLNNKKYACYSSYPEDEMPPCSGSNSTDAGCHQGNAGRLAG